MNAPINIQARRAARPTDARGVVENICDGIANLDAQVRSLAWQTVTEERIAAAERTARLVLGMFAELRAHLPLKQDGAA